MSTDLHVPRESLDPHMAALRSLLQAGGAVSVARVLSHIERQQLPLSGRLAELLQMVTEADVAGAVTALTRHDLSPRTRVLLIEALSCLDAAEAITALIGETQFPDAGVRASAIAALGKTMPRDFGPLLPAAMHDPDWRVRCAAAEAGADGQTTGFINGLIVLLMDEVWLVRFTAEASLARLGIATPHGLGTVLLGAPPAAGSRELAYA